MRIRKAHRGPGNRQIRLVLADDLVRQATPTPKEPSGTWVSAHALDRLREHHPHIGVRGALTLLCLSTEVERGFAAALLGRCMEAVPDHYFFSEDRRGVFVVARSASHHAIPWTLVTYVRLGALQHDVATRLLGAA